jgi:hypothetical protein
MARCEGSCHNIRRIGMNKDWLLLALLAAFLLLAMVLTLLFGGDRSRHGYGRRGNREILYARYPPSRTKSVSESHGFAEAGRFSLPVVPHRRKMGGPG